MLLPHVFLLADNKRVLMILPSCVEAASWLSSFTNYCAVYVTIRLSHLDSRSFVSSWSQPSRSWIIPGHRERCRNDLSLSWYPKEASFCESGAEENGNLLGSVPLWNLQSDGRVSIVCFLHPSWYLDYHSFRSLEWSESISLYYDTMSTNSDITKSLESV